MRIRFEFLLESIKNPSGIPQEFLKGFFHDSEMILKGISRESQGIPKGPSKKFFKDSTVLHRCVRNAYVRKLNMRVKIVEKYV